MLDEYGSAGSDFISFELILSSEIARSYGSLNFKCLRKYPSVFHTGSANLDSHQQFVRVLFSSHPHRHLSFVFMTIAILRHCKVISHSGFDLHFPDD
jgi:hypothetical protein